MNNEFQWIPFYGAFAKKILEYKDKRHELMEIMQQLHEEEPLLNYLNFDREDWWEPRGNEIDPFSIFATFNRQITDKNRIRLIKRYAEEFNINEEIPIEFNSIPVLNNLNSFYFNQDGILWDLFIEAMNFDENEGMSEKFQTLFDKSLSLNGNGLSSITIGLYWIRPNVFISLDSRNVEFLAEQHKISFKAKDVDGEKYNELLQTIKIQIPNTSIPMISFQAWHYTKNPNRKVNYSTGLSVEDWVELLNNPKVFNQQSLEIMKRIKDYGGSASCSQLSNKYGETVNFYNRGSSALGKRIYDETHCNVYKENGKNRWWRILYTATDTVSENNEMQERDGTFVWKLRDELNEALNQVELSHIKLYADELDVQPSQNFWWINANPKIWSFSSINVGETIEYTLTTEHGGKRRIYQNFLDAKVGDLVICYESSPVKQVVALGKIVQENNGKNIVLEKTKNLLNPIDYSSLKESEELNQLEFFSNMNGTLFKVMPEEYDFIIELIDANNEKRANNEEVQEYSKIDFLDEVYLSEESYETLIALLLHKKNIILQGAPGVGKTFTAKRLAWSIMGKKDDTRIEMVQFHQNYSYEDFILGYKPKEDTFELQEGIFVRFCRLAANDPENDYFFIIDEINRANMSKVFGELLMLIENEYRDEKIVMPYSGKQFSVPNNLYIIGMMNTADRSLAMIDYALRRRFSFFEMEPAFDSEGFKQYQEALNNEQFNNVIYQIKSLNFEIEAEATLGKGFCIGHSYFTGQSTYSEEWIRRIIKYDIVPMLNEYWFDENEKIGKWEKQFRGVFDE